ncbi:uncharacterized protein JCM6883_001752 [Sporobolomyces salmoneus]|uniref:uncharacterized protein n=1 Tax=Sporobolomyces salmoneus TaxID=183962 RepID=UPI003176D071
MSPRKPRPPLLPQSGPGVSVIRLGDSESSKARAERLARERYRRNRDSLQGLTERIQKYKASIERYESELKSLEAQDRFVDPGRSDGERLNDEKRKRIRALHSSIARNRSLLAEAQKKLDVLKRDHSPGHLLPYKSSHELHDASRSSSLVQLQQRPPSNEPASLDDYHAWTPPLFPPLVDASFPLPSQHTPSRLSGFQQLSLLSNTPTTLPPSFPLLLPAVEPLTVAPHSKAAHRRPSSIQGGRESVAASIDRSIQECRRNIQRQESEIKWLEDQVEAIDSQPPDVKRSQYRTTLKKKIGAFKANVTKNRQRIREAEAKLRELDPVHSTVGPDTAHASREFPQTALQPHLPTLSGESPPHDDLGASSPGFPPLPPFGPTQSLQHVAVFSNSSHPSPPRPTLPNKPLPQEDAQQNHAPSPVAAGRPFQVQTRHQSSRSLGGATTVVDSTLVYLERDVAICKREVSDWRAKILNIEQSASMDGDIGLNGTAGEHLRVSRNMLAWEEQQLEIAEETLEEYKRRKIDGEPKK